MGIESAEVVAINKFGNVIFTDQSGRYWRICPEELECKVIAESKAAYGRLQNEPDFEQDWEMMRLVEMAEAKYGARSLFGRRRQSNQRSSAGEQS